MAGWAQKIIGYVTGNGAEVTAGNRLKVDLETDVGANPAQVGAVRMFSENDSGARLGFPTLLSPETDQDFRLRVAQDALHDCETFNYTAQNTGKHLYANTTMVNTWTAAGLTTNSGNITTTTTGTRFQSYTFVPLVGSAVVYSEFTGNFTAQPTANTIIDIGMFLAGAANPYAPTDGAYFRLNSAGLFGVINSNGTETTSAVFPFTYVNGKNYQFIIVITERATQFWIDGELWAELATPAANGQPFMSSSLPAFALRHAITGGAAGAALSFVLKDYVATSGGYQVADDFGTIGNRLFGSYQGLSGGTMGSLANYANSANPTPAVPTNTTAALAAGLGGQFWETATLAVNTDGIIASYQVPAATANVQGKRLKITGLYLMSHVQTVVAGGPYVAQYSLAFGHTAVSLATAEAAAAKAPRRIALPAFTQLVTAAQAVSTMVAQPGGAYMAFDQPIYVNPGEFVQLVTKHIGTVATAGVIAHVFQPVYSWE